MYLQNDKCKLRQIIYSEDKLLFVKLSVQAAIYLFYHVQIKYTVFYDDIFSLFTYMSFHTLCSRKPTYTLLISIGYITVRFLQTGKQMQQELPALYKPMGSFQ